MKAGLAESEEAKGRREPESNMGYSCHVVEAGETLRFLYGQWETGVGCEMTRSEFLKATVRSRRKVWRQPEYVKEDQLGSSCKSTGKMQLLFGLRWQKHSGR